MKKKTPLEQNTISKNNVIINKKQKNNNRSKNCKVLKNSQISSSRIKTIKNNQNEENQNPDDKSSHNEDNNMMNIDNKFNELLSIGNNSNISTERELKNIYINNWLICCFNCSSRKKNINKALLEEGYKIVTKKLDILNIFHRLYINELMEKNFEIETKDISMSDKCKYDLKAIVLITVITI